MNRQDFVITRISDGLQFGHGSISGQADSPAVLTRVDKVILNAHDILVPVGRHDNGRFIQDDGCGDGREVAQVFAGRKTYKQSLNRSKVFGGSATMTAASLIGTGQVTGQALSSVFSDAIQALEARDIDFGAHIDERASGENCGCGAIDRAPEAILAALKYEQPVRDVLNALAVDVAELDTVYHNFRIYVQHLPADTIYSGRQVMDQIIRVGKVVKKLSGEHRERRIILNMVREYTVNQALIREETDGQAQAFAVDIWRLGDIADRLFPESEQRRDQAYLSELIYTVAIAAVLTKGDLPIDVIEAAATTTVTA
jgi:hypothetical protein